MEDSMGTQKTITIGVDGKDLDKLRYLSEKNGQPVSWQIRQAMKLYIESRKADLKDFGK
jgi:predicted DNA-binding protein